jgi:hypothetical protein
VGTIQEEQIFIFKTTEESAGWIKIKKKKIKCVTYPQEDFLFRIHLEAS